MTLLDLIKEQIENKYNYIGFDLGNIEFVYYKIYKSKIIHIKLKDS